MLTHEPLLQLQRDLYRLPLGRKRFDTYIKTMTDSDGGMKLPLSAMNPMAKDHVPLLLDTYLSLNADERAQAIVEDFTVADPFGKDEFRTALVIADDAQGGWTNRFTTDFANRFESRPMFRRGWLVALLWSSEPASVQTVKRTVKAAIYRGIWIHQHGYGTNLGQMLAQEQFALSQAGYQPQLSSDELAYTAEVIQPLLKNEDPPTLFAALYGDLAAERLGYPSLGLSQNAGFHFAAWQKT